MNKYDYKSVFAPFFNRFLDMKESMGFTVRNFKPLFKELDVFFINQNITEPIITHSMIEKWKTLTVNEKESNVYRKHLIIIQFSKYMCHIGYSCYVPRAMKHKTNNFIPYIFTTIQIQDIFSACDMLSIEYGFRNRRSNIFPIPAIFRLIYSVGLRANEAISLKNKDVDLVSNAITVRETKNKLHRLLPINESLRNVLLQYRDMRDKLMINGINEPDAHFFISPCGNPVKYDSLYNWFRRVLNLCSIPFIGGSQGPRIHDLRHTCAVHSLMKQVKDNVDIYCALPILSIFLGHKSTRATEQYVRLTQEMFPDIVKLEHNISQYVFPNKSEYETI